MVPFLSARMTSVLAETGDFSSQIAGGRETEPACAGTIRPTAATTGTPASRTERNFIEKSPVAHQRTTWRERITETVRRQPARRGGSGPILRFGYSLTPQSFGA